MTEASYAAPPVWLDIYGHCVEIRSSCASALNGISEDFAFFRSQGGSGSRIVDLVEQAPPYEQLPPLTANVYTPHNVSYRDGNRTYVDYSGRALGVHHRDTGNFTIYGENADLLYEGAYLFLLSQCGRRLTRADCTGCMRSA